MRIDLKGIHSTYAKLADGSNKIYWYAWRGGPRLRGEPGSPDFIASYNEAVATAGAVARGQACNHCSTVFQQSGDFPRCASAPARLHQPDQVHRTGIADFPIKALAARDTRGVFMDWRDKLALKSVGRPIMHGRCWRAFCPGRRIAARSPSIPASGAAASITARASISFGRIDDEAAFLEHAPAHLHLPLLLALWTGQRQGDLLRLTWSAYDGTHIRLAAIEERPGRVAWCM